MNRIDIYVMFFAIMVFAHCGTNAVAADHYEVGFSTFLGGSDWEHARDVFVDDYGNVSLTGGTQSADFPTTNGALQRQQHISGNQIGSGGYCDASVCIFDACGRRLWSTYLGGPNSR